MEDQGEETEVSVLSTSDTSDTDEHEGYHDDLLSTQGKSVGFNLQSQTSFFEVTLNTSCSWLWHNVYLQKTVDMLDSSEGTIDFRYSGTEENVMSLEKIKKEKRLLQENLDK